MGEHGQARRGVRPRQPDDRDQGDRHADGQRGQRHDGRQDSRSARPRRSGAGRARAASVPESAVPSAPSLLDCVTAFGRGGAGGGLGERAEDAAADQGPGRHLDGDRGLRRRWTSGPGRPTSSPWSRPARRRTSAPPAGRSRRRCPSRWGARCRTGWPSAAWPALMSSAAARAAWPAMSAARSRAFMAFPPSTMSASQEDDRDREHHREHGHRALVPVRLVWRMGLVGLVRGRHGGAGGATGVGGAGAAAGRRAGLARAADWGGGRGHCNLPPAHEGVQRRDGDRVTGVAPGSRAAVNGDMLTLQLTR